MKVEKREGSLEKRIVTAMVVDKVVLGRLSSKWGEGQHFKNKWCNLVGNWCIHYFDNYGEPPGRHLVGIFESWVTSEQREKETVELLERFLTTISEEYTQLKEEVNSDWILDQAAILFNKTKLLSLAEALQGDVESGDVEQAWKRVHNTGKIEVGVGEGIDVLQDQNAIMEAFEESQEPVITYPGDLGIMLNPHLVREGFISFEGPEKRGKSWFLVDIAWRAMLQRKKVAFFAVGDMSRSQMLRRFMTRAARRPIRPCKIQYPKSISKDPDEDVAQVAHEEIEYPNGLSWQKAWRSCQEIIDKDVRTKKTLLKLSVHPNSSINVAGIKSILGDWERQDWIPDVVVLDYADILAPPYGGVDSREQINSTWKQLRGLSMSIHCLLVTATQSKASGYSAVTLGMEDFSEDKRKRAHITGCIGINRTKEEKDLGIYRLNWIALREGDYREGRCVHVASCLEIANPCVRSTF